MASPTSDADVALIARAVTQLARRLRSKRPKASVTLSALGMLSTLHRAGPMPAVELARAERLKPQSLSRLIARLEKDGMISREPDPRDSRALIISITTEGKLALRHDMQARRDWLGMALGATLSADERLKLTEAAFYMLRLVEADLP
jgi:DNA-binding MarR family transcriptional regulator